MKLFDLENEQIIQDKFRIDFCKPERDQDIATCEGPSPAKKKRKIVIHPDLLLEGKEKELMEEVIHEVTHGAFYCLDEDYVDPFAKHLTRILWKIGFRLTEDV